MRKLPMLALAALLLPAGAAAQKPAATARPPAARRVDMTANITLAGARNLALGQTRSSLQQRTSTCCARMNPQNLRVADSKQVIVHWRYLYLVAVETPGVKTHVRVLVDPKTGSVVDVQQRPWPWSAAPEYWTRGLNVAEPTPKVEGKVSAHH